MRRVGLKTKQRVKPGHENDYCVLYGYQNAQVFLDGGFARLAGKARRLSRHIGEAVVDGFRYAETDQCEKGLAAVCIEIYEQYPDKTVRRLDFFESGKYSHTIKDTWTAGGVHKTERMKSSS